MSRKVGIVGTGFPDFEIAVDKFEKNVIEEIKRIVAETAEMLVSEARAKAPVAPDGGHLRHSIGVEYFNDGLTAIVSVGAEYRFYVEHGTGIYSDLGTGRETPWVYYSEKLGRWVWTRGMKAQPFWRPSVEIAMKHFKDEMNKLGA